MQIPVRATLAASTARPVGVVVAFVGTALVLVEPASTSRWIGLVQDTGMYLTVLSFAIAGSLFSVAGYLTGSRRLERATELARGVRPLTSACAAVCSGDLMWLVGGLAVVHVAAFARTFAAGAAPSAMAWSLEVLAFASASACYLMGVLAGLVVRHPVGAVVAATAPYGATLLANQVLSVRPALQPFARQVAPYIDQSWGPSLVPAHGPILLLALYCALVAATAGQLAVGSLRVQLSGSTVLGRPRPRALIAPVGALLAAGLIAATVTADDFSTARADGWTCSTDQRVCDQDGGGAPLGKQLDGLR